MNDIKIQSSINLIQSLYLKDQKHCLAFSGGKDSIVLYDLIKKAGIPVVSQYSNTTIDPPGTISFIRKYYPDVEILQPKKSFFQLVSERGLPTRKGRFCCEELKEMAGIGMRTFDGTRWDESNSRKKYSPEDCDTRRWMKNAVHLRVILNWTELDIWNYIRFYNLPYMKYYDAPYFLKRHGCVGCPYAGSHMQLYEFKFFPRYAYALIKAISKNIQLKSNNVFARRFNSPYEVFHWWLSGKSINNFLKDQENLLFERDYKQEFFKVIQS